MYHLSFRHFFLALSMLFFTYNVFGQSARTIEGIIIDKDSGLPLQNAHIIELNTQNGTYTQKNGTFRMTINSDETILNVSYVGYHTLRYRVQDEDVYLTLSLKIKIESITPLLVTDLLSTQKSPFTYQSKSIEALENENTAKDIPFLLRSMTSVVQTSDAGNSVGYTGVRIRGIDAARINVTIDGIPLNDAESHGVYWVDLPDLVSSLDQVQVQRGVSTSSQGSSSFGGAIHLFTSNPSTTPFLQLESIYGTFNTQKYAIQYGSGLLGSSWTIQGKVAKIVSNGYIDRAFSDLQSLSLSLQRFTSKSLLKVNMLFGEEKTYQAWYGVPEPTLENDNAELKRYINQLGLNTRVASHWQENIGNRAFNHYTYDNQIDHYKQDHYHLHYQYDINTQWTLKTSLHYTYGRGYYEEFEYDQELENYGIQVNNNIQNSDLIRQKWLDNHYYGVLLYSDYYQDKWNISFGASYHRYDGDHFGEIIWARYAGDSHIGQRYYFNEGDKNDGSVYSKFNWTFLRQWNLYADMQYRWVDYSFLGKDLQPIAGEQRIVDIQQKVNHGFFNPKFGITWNTEPWRWYLSVGIAQKEPTRNEYVDSSPHTRPKPEQLLDIETGATWKNNLWQVDMTLYSMLYNNQLIPTGSVNDVGEYVRENVEDSYRIGAELTWEGTLYKNIIWMGNVAVSQNKIPEFIQYLDNYDMGSQQSQVYKNTTLAFSPSFTAANTFQYKWNHGHISWNMRYVSRQYLDNTQTMSRSLSPYMTHDLSITYTINVNSYFKTINMVLSIANLTNAQYESNGYTYGWISGGEEQYFNFYYPQAPTQLSLKMVVKF